MARKSAAKGTGTAGRKGAEASGRCAATAAGRAERLPDAPNLRGLARAHAAAAVEALAAVMRDPSATPAARVSAAGALLAWGYGKSAPAEDGHRAERSAERTVRLVWGGADA